MKTQKFSHKTPHLKGKKHQLDPNLDLKQLVHHATVQYVDRDADGDVDVYDNPKKPTPDENPIGDFATASKKLISKQKGEIQHSKKRIAYEEKMNGRCKPGYYYCYTNKECRPIPAGFMVDPEGMLRKETGASVDEGTLRKWFKSSKSKDGKPGWVNVVTGGTCASDEPGEGVPKCVSSEKRERMTPAERRSSARRKKSADSGQQQKTGAAKPTYVPTNKPNKMNEAKERDHEYSMARSELSTIMNAAKRLKKKMQNGEGNIEAWVQSKITKAADYLDSAADYIDSGEMSEEKDVKGKGSGKKDACYNKVKSRYSVWPSAYASGALVKCRNVGADNWGNKTESLSPISHKILSELNLDEKCWSGYEKKGMKTMFGKQYPNCVKKEEEEDKCSHTEEGKECPIHGKKECPLMVDEAVKITSKTGNIVLVSLMWRGKYYTMKLFFPQIAKPNRKEVQDQIEKVYPGSRVQSFYISDIKPGEQFLQVSEELEMQEAWYSGKGQYRTTVSGRSVRRDEDEETDNAVSDMLQKKREAAAKKAAQERMKAKGSKLFGEDWQKVNRQDKTDGLSPEAVKAYRRENPGSKLQTAVTEKDPTGKRAERRKSFCRRMKGMKSKLTSTKTSRDPDSRINKALRRWNCN